MNLLKGNCLVAQSGGPTAVINASACGVVEAALGSQVIDKVYGAHNGVAGILNENLFLFNEESPSVIELLKVTPGAALGSCRYKLKSIEANEADYKRILDVFKAHDIRYFFYIGGNDSMDTAHKVSQYAERAGYELRVMGVPKTIDNDLPLTDHTPGFGSTAKYIATSIREIGLDACVYNYPTVTIVECMGRNAGWITAASALARRSGCDAPHAIYLPEVPFSFEQFGKDVADAIEKHNCAVIAVSEGIKNEEGRYISEVYAPDGTTDAFGHVQLGGVGQILESYVAKNITKKVRAVIFSTVQRCAAHCGSQTDSEEAFLCGKSAVGYALKGHNGKMVILKRESAEPYVCTIDIADLGEVANKEKIIPREWINEIGNDVSQEVVDYIKPLIFGEVKTNIENGLPVYAKLERKYIDKKLEPWNVK